MNFAFKIRIYHGKTQILHKPLLKKQYFHTNLLKIHIKLHEIANFLEKLQSKQALGVRGVKAPPHGRYKIFHYKIDKSSDFWWKIEHFYKKISIF